MPNWAFQKVVIKGTDLTSLAEVLRDKTDGWFLEAAHISRQFALLGVLGRVKPIYNITFENYPQLTKGLGDVTKENTAFSRWLGYLIEDRPLTEEVAANIKQLAKEIDWDKHLSEIKESDEAKELVGSGENALWDFNDENIMDKWTQPPTDHPRLSLYHIVPLLVSEAICSYGNGSSPFSNKGFLSRYSANIARIGSKWATIWPTGFHFTVEDNKVKEIAWYHKSAWGPVLESLCEVSFKYAAEVEVIYAEQGMGFCGRRLYSVGCVIEAEDDDMQWDKEGLEKWEEDGEDDDVPYESFLKGPYYIIDLPELGG